MRFRAIYLALWVVMAVLPGASASDSDSATSAGSISETREHQPTYYRREEDNGTVSFTDNPPRYSEWDIYIKGKSRSGSRFRDYMQNFRLYDDRIRSLGKEYNLDPALIKAVVMTESAFNPKALSRTGAQGLMQLMPETARIVGCPDPWNPEENLAGGARYLKQMQMKFGSTRLAIAAYNAGPRAVKKYNGIPPFAETQQYVRRVEAFHQQFRENDLSFATRE